MSQFSATLDNDSLSHAVGRLCAIEPRFTPVVERHGLPSLRQGPDGLTGLLQIVTEQFLSLAAAQAIWTRIENQLHPITPAGVLRTEDTTLLALGLSRAKVKSFKAIARAFAEGSINSEALRAADDSAARRQLLDLPGIGPWSADIYLLSSLLRADAWPVGDLALQISAQHLFRLRQRPTPERMNRLGAAFRPHRAVAARLLWSHYRGLKALPQAA